MIGINSRTPGSRPDRNEENGRRPIIAGASIGALLRERREALGASLAEVEAATKIRQKYLSALEADEWQVLPGEVVGRGFLRNYAGYLGLEPTEIIERRRAVADPSLSGALASTSAGSDLPPMREVDYRPKAVDLREEPESLEERQPPRVGPLLGVLGAIAVLVLFWWGLSRFGGSLLDGATSAASGFGNAVAGIFSSDPTPTPDATQIALDEANRTAGLPPTATSTSVFDAPLTEGTGGAAPLPAAGAAPAVVEPAPAPTTDPALRAPTATPTLPPPTPEPPTATPVPPTPTPQPLPAQANTQANLRAAPNTEAPIVGATEPGQQINIVGQTSDAQWFLLDSGAWIFAQLVTNPPAAAPVTDPTAVPPGAELPTATPVAPEQPAPEPVVAPAACADPRSQIASPGQGQTISGVVSIIGTATHEAFQSYKIEAGPPGGALAFIGAGNTQITGGQLGAVNSASFPNGLLLIRLTVVDQSGNFPPPCDVTVTAQN